MRYFTFLAKGMGIALLALWIFPSCQVGSHSPTKQNTPEDTLALDSLLDEIQNLRYVDRAQALSLAYQGLDMVREFDLQAYEIALHGELGCLYREEGAYDQAAISFDHAIHIERI